MRTSWIILLAPVALLAVWVGRQLAGAQADQMPPSGMVLVPAGPFVMGSSEADAERPRREVYVEAFFIDKHEVTNAEYSRFVRAMRRNPPVASEQPPIPGHNLWRAAKPQKDILELPVVNVTWADAAAYAAWLGRRLPTEAEWEKAARGTDGRTYPWGNEFRKGACNLEGRGASPAGSFPRDLSPFGCFDMAGNVAEWTADGFKPYPGSPAPAPYDEACKVLRGGAWDYLINSPRCAARLPAAPDVKSNYFGFRCAKSLSENP